jgi:type IV pilus assembly protein PilP
MRWVNVITAAALILGLAACEEETVAPPTNVQPPAPAKSAAGKKGDTKTDEADAGAALPVAEFTEASFVESEDSRDPFRDFAHLFAKKRTGDKSLQREVKASQFALDELKLVGVVTGSARLVMLQDPVGFAWTATTGEYVGKAELVAVGGTDGREVAINWRVDRIRSSDVVFIREDTAHPEIPPTTRVMPLYPDEDLRSGG